MTQLIDRPITAGSTLSSRAYPVAPDLQPAEDFYEQGAASGRDVTIRVASPTSPQQAWLASYMESQINALRRLRRGWDGHRAESVSDEAVRSVVHLISRFATGLSLPPMVFPIPDGGLQLEWHADRQSVEIEVDGMGDAHALATDEDGSILLNTELVAGEDDGLAQAQQAVEQLSTRLLRAR